nr:YcdB/YcdC domain-containing protein [Paenibacillus hamazuiensis]
MPAVSQDDASQQSAAVDAKVSKDDAVSIARKQFDLSGEYTVENVSFNSYFGNLGLKKPSWQLSFVKKNQDRYLESINVTLDANSGKILQYNRYNSDPTRRVVYPPQTDFQHAKQIASDYLQKTAPEEMKTARYNDMFESGFKTPLQGEVRYQIRYDRTVNGIPFPQQYVNVEVDGTGAIVGYQNYWDDSLEFPKADNVIGQEQAEKTIRSEADISLMYTLPYQRGKNDDLITAYQATLPTLDAVTGKPWNIQNGAPQVKKDRKPLADKPQAEKPSGDKALTKEQAIETVTAAFGLPEGAKLEDASYNEYNDPNNPSAGGTWNIRWNVGGDSTGKFMPSGDSIWAVVSAKTGEIRSYNRSFGGPVPLPVQAQEKNAESASAANAGLTEEQAKDRAVGAIRKLMPYYLHELALYSTNELPIMAVKMDNSSGYQFFFKRVIDGVEANYEGVNVTVNRNTGDIVSFDNSISQIAYPAAKPQTISLEKATELLLSQYRIELQYAVEYKNPDTPSAAIPVEKYNVMVAAGKIAPEPGTASLKLVYAPVSKLGAAQYDSMLDAVSGEWRNRNTGEITKMGQTEITDIQGHASERALRLMAEYGALDVRDGKINPEQTMTRGEMIKMLIIALNGGYFQPYYGAGRAASFSDVKKDSDYFAYVEAAVDRRLIDPSASGEFRPEEKMNREDLAQLYARALGYYQLAQVPNMFQLNASDSAQIQQPGIAAVVANLGIMPTISGEFQPKAAVTRAEAAASFYRYLQKRSELQDPWPRY